MSTDAPKWPWSELGLGPDERDARSIRRAYAARLKALPEGDVAAFETLRNTYEVALRRAGAGRKQRRVVPEALSSARPPDADHHPDPAAAGERPERAAPASPPEPPAAPRPEPEPAPEPEPTPKPEPDPDQAILAQARTLLRNESFESGLWDRILRQIPMMQRPAARQLEGMVLATISRSGPEKGATPPAGWVRQMDQHFGWRADAVGFARRFPQFHGAMEQILGPAIRAGDIGQADDDTGYFARLIRQLIPYIGLVVLVFAPTAILQTLGLDGPAELYSGAALFSIFFVGAGWWLGQLFLAPVLVLLSWSSPVLRRVVRRARGVMSRPLGRQPLLRLKHLVFLACLLVLGGLRLAQDSLDTGQPRLSRPALWQVAGTTLIGLPAATAPRITPDPLNSLPRFLHFDAAAPAREPSMLVTCHHMVQFQVRSCSLTAAAPGNLLRVIEITAPHPARGLMRQVMEMPRLQLRKIATGEETVLSDWQPLTAVDLLPRRVQLFLHSGAPSLYGATEVSGLSSPPEDSDIRLSVAWPDTAAMLSGLTRLCMDKLDAEAVPLEVRQARCPVTPGDIGRQAQRFCDPGETQQVCLGKALRNDLLTATDAPLPAVEIRFDDPDLALMRRLMWNMAAPHQAVPLPRTPRVQALRDRVLMDYAVLLDHPMAAQDRMSRMALDAALRRQPHLFGAYRTSLKRRSEVWDSLLSTLAEAGFDVSDVAPLNGPAR
ncbi:hypothetical protein [Oceanicola sp. S124]|uniref:hypothetical protein n=1 Tax=Oceanicola sp. S124 TaxID=1042378 RepID=UPI0002558245|nr:hypothetical protein [Oceanicola sp. S124]